MQTSKILLLTTLSLSLIACGQSEQATSEPTPAPSGERIDTNEAVQDMKSVEGKVDWPKLEIDEASFKCLDDMVKVRHFYVDNLVGRLDETVAVARSTDGGVYPPGSVVQLVPTEVMIKHPPGWNAATKDWETTR